MSEKTGERRTTPGVRKNWGEVGRGWGEKFPSLVSPPPSAPYFSYSIPVSFLSRKLLETPATQATRNWICKFLKRTFDRDIPYEAKVCVPDDCFIYI